MGFGHRVYKSGDSRVPTMREYFGKVAKIKKDKIFEKIYDIEKNPLGWLDTMLNAVEHMNFFEGRATEYSKASTQGTWVEAFS